MFVLLLTFLFCQKEKGTILINNDYALQLTIWVLNLTWITISKSIKTSINIAVHGFCLVIQIKKCYVWG